MKDTWSADHFDQEVKCTMTELSGLLECARDTIFKVAFKKKVDPKDLEASLMACAFKDISNDGKLKALSKGMTEGEACEITGHLVDVDNSLGRSTVIDLNAKAPNNFRQVDHRTIDYIILRNVKYALGRKAPGGPAELPVKVDRTKPRWNESKLAVGNWFSQVTYYKLKEIIDKDNVKVENCRNEQELTLSRDILLTEMHNGSAFASTEKVTRTEMVNKLLSAKECVMSIKFHKKVDEAWVKQCI